MTTPTVGDAIEVYWPDDNRYYSGEIAHYDPSSDTYSIHYNDGEVEFLILAFEQWRFLTATVKEPCEASCSSPKSSFFASLLQPYTSLMTLNDPPELQSNSSTKQRVGDVGSPLSVMDNPTRDTSPRLRPHRSACKTVRNSCKRKLSTQDPRGSKRMRSIPFETGLSDAPYCRPSFKLVHDHAFVLIGACIDHWLHDENRRKSDMFSIHLCLNEILSMLTSAAVDLKHQKKLLRKKDEGAEWVISGEIKECRRFKYTEWRQPHSDVEWNCEKRMLRKISLLLRRGSSFKRSNEVCDNRAVEAMRYVFRAQELLRRYSSFH